MTKDKTGWKADPVRGEALVEPRRAEVVQQLRQSADVAFFHVEQDLAYQIEMLKKKAGEQKQKITRMVEDATTKPAMDIVRKYWNEKPEDMWKHFVYNMTERS